MERIANTMILTRITDEMASKKKPKAMTTKWCIKRQHMNQKLPFLLIPSRRKWKERMEKIAKRNSISNNDKNINNRDINVTKVSVEYFYQVNRMNRRRPMVNISNKWPQYMTHNTNSICGCPFNCVWTDSSNYLTRCDLFLRLNMRWKYILAECGKWIRFGNACKNGYVEAWLRIFTIRFMVMVKHYHDLS